MIELCEDDFTPDNIFEVLVDEANADKKLGIVLNGNHRL